MKAQRQSWLTNIILSPERKNEEEERSSYVMKDDWPSPKCRNIRLRVPRTPSTSTKLLQVEGTGRYGKVNRAMIQSLVLRPRHREAMASYDHLTP